MTVYFDNAATTMVRQEAADVMVRMMCEDYGNPSSTHVLGRKAASELNLARKRVAAALGCQDSEVYFTSGGTEADNWAVFGTAKLMRHRGKHIITTAVEHDAIRKACDSLKADGYDITYVKPDNHGRVTAEAVGEALRSDTVLVSVMLVNNETGAVNPVADISKMLRSRGSQALLHTDEVLSAMAFATASVTS
ncbi:MAG: aminotransferase class V-fold PLP-dependent enzyme [Oscillospiraceae bacterium]|nr:aminotransferase class V-fold PLP-dependent enzyme [Oscillospiraceae bacterium]